MVLRRFRRVAKSVAKRAVKEIARRALEETTSHEADSSQASDLSGGAAESDAVAASMPKPKASSANESVTQERGVRSKSKSSTQRRAKSGRGAKAKSNPSAHAPEREPLRTRTMARLLMKQERWARALMIYDQLQAEKGPSGSFADLALGAERMTACHELAQEQEAPVHWPHLRRHNDELRLHRLEVREDDRAADRPLHLAILCFDRTSLVEWDVQRDDRVAASSSFSFKPAHRGGYAIAAVDRDGALRWVTPIFEWDETKS